MVLQQIHHITHGPVKSTVSQLLIDDASHMVWLMMQDGGMQVAILVGI